jgi:hypothetical protein
MTSIENTPKRDLRTPATQPTDELVYGKRDKYRAAGLSELDIAILEQPEDGEGN